MKRLAVFLTMSAVLLTACAFLREPGDPGVSPTSSDGPTQDRPTPAATPSATVPAATPTAAPPASPGVAGSFSAKPLAPAGSIVLTGNLASDSVEGGCSYLETAEGKRYQVIYPDGWRFDGATGRLVGPGDSSAGPGSVVSVRGSIVADMASTCQIGPIFRASEVISAGG